VPDNYEENNDFTTAYRFSGNPKTFWGAIYPSGDYDYFVTTLWVGNSIRISLTNIPSGKNYNLCLWRHNWGAYEFIVCSEQSGNTDENILYIVTGIAGYDDFYIVVQPATSSDWSCDSQYRLDITIE
jgi:hypothetical protein